MTFEAQYHGECAECGLEVRGKMVEYNANNEVIHVFCPEPEAPRPVCPRCFIEMPLVGGCPNCE